MYLMKNLNEKNIINFITLVIFISIIFFTLKESTTFFENPNLLGVKSKEERVQITHKIISPQEYKEKLLSEEYVSIDIRNKKEHDREKISDDILIDFYSNDFAKNLNKLDKNKKYIFYCRSGNRSASAVSVFSELGFTEVYELEGGISN